MHSWNRLRAWGGGLWVTKACHDFDAINWLGGDAPTRVWATSGLGHYRPRPEVALYCRDCLQRQTCPDFHDALNPQGLTGRLWACDEAATGYRRDLCLYNSDKDTFDHGMAVLDYAGGARATYTVNVVSAYTTRQLSISGTEGMAQGDLSAGTVTFWPRYRREPETIDLRERMQSGHGGADDRILADFFHCCRTGDAPRSGWADGRLSVQVALAARQACDTGQPIDLAPAHLAAASTGGPAAGSYRRPSGRIP